MCLPDGRGPERRRAGPRLGEFADLLSQGIGPTPVASLARDQTMRGDPDLWRSWTADQVSAGLRVDVLRGQSGMDWWEKVRAGWLSSGTDDESVGEFVALVEHEYEIVKRNLTLADET